MYAGFVLFLALLIAGCQLSNFLAKYELVNVLMCLNKLVIHFNKCNFF